MRYNCYISDKLSLYLFTLLRVSSPDTSSLVIVNSGDFKGLYEVRTFAIYYYFINSSYHSFNVYLLLPIIIAILILPIPLF